MLRPSTLSLLLAVMQMQLLAGEPPPAPYAVAARFQRERILVTWHYPGVNRQVLYHSRFEADGYFFVTESPGDNRAAVCFANPDPDAAWESVEIFLWGQDPFPDSPGGPESPFGLDIYAGQPNRSLLPLWSIETQADSVAETGSWIGIPVARAFPQLDTAWLQFRWVETTPTAPLLGYDSQGSSESQSSFGIMEYGELKWQPLNQLELMVRANLTRTDTLEALRDLTNMPDSFLLHLESISGDSTAELRISDSLHCFLDPAQFGGWLLSIAAEEESLRSAFSPRIQLGLLDTLPSPIAPENERLQLALKPGESTSAELGIVSSWPDTLLCHIDLPENTWLSVASTEMRLPPKERIVIDFSISTAELAGEYDSSIVRLTCLTDGVVFTDLEIPVEIEIQHPTATCDVVLPESYDYRLSQNFPNPFNSETTLYSSSSQPVAVFDILGRQIALLRPTGGKSARGYPFVWNGRTATGQDVASGLYFYRQQGSAGTRKMLLLK